MARFVTTVPAVVRPSTRSLSGVFALLFVLAVALVCSQQARANPTMEVGGIASFPVNGSDAPAAGTTWSITLAGTTIATSLVPNGWSVGGGLPASGGGPGVQPLAAIL